MTNWKTRLKQEFDDNPLQVIGVLALAATAGAKVINALSGIGSRRAYARRYPYSQKRR